jgi:hypothetical protein
MIACNCTGLCAFAGICIYEARELCASHLPSPAPRPPAPRTPRCLSLAGVLVSAFGFPPVLQGNWRHARVTDVDPEHGGPVLPAEGEPLPAAICIVNPFGYRVADIHYYRRYCDEHGVLLWFDNAACPIHWMPDGTNLNDLADASTISLHETKVIGRGEGGVLLVKPEHFTTAFRAINFGYDYAIPPETRGGSYHRAASNYRMSDVVGPQRSPPKGPGASPQGPQPQPPRAQPPGPSPVCNTTPRLSCAQAAAAILASWELNWEGIERYMHEHDDEVSSLPGIHFVRGGKGSFVQACLEFRRPRPNFEVKYYYYPLLSRGEAPEAWRIFDETQSRPFHPPGGPQPYGLGGPNHSDKP